MKNEKEVNKLLQLLYGRIGGDPASIKTVRPLYGGWHNALRYEVTRADGARTMIEREHILETNEAALTHALRAFAVQRHAKTPARPGELASRTGESLACACGYTPAVSARFCSRCGHELHGDMSTAAARPPRRRRRGVVVAIALACLAGTASYWLASRDVSREDGASHLPGARAAETASHAVQRMSLERATPPTPAIAEQTYAGTTPPQGPDSNPLRAPAPGPSETVGPGPRATVAPQPSESVAAAARETTAPSSRQTLAPSPRQTAARPQAERRADFNRTRRAASRADAAARPRSVDAVFMEHANSQCGGGLGGFVCRERLRFGLCKSRWTDGEVAGMTICNVAGGGRPPS